MVEKVAPQVGFGTESAGSNGREWHEEALKHLPAVLEGRRPPRYSVTYGGIDAFNAQMTKLKGGLSTG